jgi:hypothetical protein
VEYESYSTLEVQGKGGHEADEVDVGVTKEKVAFGHRYIPKFSLPLCF